MNSKKIKKENTPEKKENAWMESEGELAVDVYSTEKEVIIQAAIAGVNPDNINVSAENDMIIIKGERFDPCEEKEKNYYFKECYWGKFSRKIIIPEEIDSSRIEADIKSGILNIRVPLIIKGKKSVQVKKN